MSGYCVSFRPAAEGSFCGERQVCRDGKCTEEVENIILKPTNVTTIITNDNNNNNNNKNSCHDNDEDLSGYSCEEFLKLYGYRYCNHLYIKKNCCASHSVICNNKLVNEDVKP